MTERRWNIVIGQVGDGTPEVKLEVPENIADTILPITNSIVDANRRIFDLSEKLLALDKDLGSRITELEKDLAEAKTYLQQDEISIKDIRITLLTLEDRDSNLSIGISDNTSMLGKLQKDLKDTDSRLVDLEIVHETAEVPEPSDPPEPEPEDPSVVVIDPPTGPTFYVAPHGTNGDAKTLSTAWNELDKIDWNVIVPGSTIIIDAGVYEKPLFTQRGGTKDSPITIQRTTMSGYVTEVHSQIKIWHPYIIFDGLDEEKFIIYPNDTMCGFFIGYWDKDATGVWVKNFTMLGEYSTQRGVSMNLYSPETTVQGVKLIKSPGEDQIKVLAKGNISILNCDFSGQEDSGTDVHRDIIAFYNVPAEGSLHLVKGCYFHDSETDTIGVFPSSGARLGSITIIENTFYNVDTCIKFDSSRILSIEHAGVVNNNYGAVQNFLVKNAAMDNLVESGNNEIFVRPDSIGD